MKIELNLPEIEGYEYTGEYRRAFDKDAFLNAQGKIQICGVHPTTGIYPMLKKKEPKYRTAGDPINLNGSKFVEIKALEDALSLVDETDLTAEGCILFNQLSALIN